MLLEQLDDAIGRAGSHHWNALREASDVVGMEAVDILHRIDPLDDRGLLDLWRQRQLHQDAVDLRVAVEVIDEGEQRDLRGRGGQIVRDGADADLLAGAALVAHVNLRGRVMADLDHGEGGPPPAARQRSLDLVADLGFDLRRQCAAVDQLRRHRDCSTRSLRGRAFSHIDAAVCGGMAQSGSASALGAEGRRFESGCPDHSYQ